jgi:hypothetical protein
MGACPGFEPATRPFGGCDGSRGPNYHNVAVNRRGVSTPIGASQAIDLPSDRGGNLGRLFTFTGRMFEAINGMLLDMLAAVARKDYVDRRRRQAQVAGASDLAHEQSTWRPVIMF